MPVAPRLPLPGRLRASQLVAVDWVVAVGYGLLGWPAFGHQIGWLGAVAMALLSGGLVLARRHPLLALAVVVPVFGLAPIATPLAFLAVLPSMVVLARVAAVCRIRVALAALVLSMVGPVATALPDFTRAGGVVPVALALTAGWLAGFALGQYRRYGDELLAHQAQSERMRIARELHDVVAHGISVITVQAGFGHLVIGEQPAAARAALATIESVGRDTLAELRRLLGVLREGDEQPALAPAPGLAELDRLVARTASAGVQVEMSVRGQPRDLTAGVDLAAYRIVQEALTNVVKHADVATVQVVLDYGAAELAIEVTDQGRGGPVTSCGHGLVGMRERAQLCGGWVRAEPLPGKGFQVAARLPLVAGQDMV